MRDRPLLLAWNGDRGRTFALIAGPRWLSGWLKLGGNLGLNVALYDAAGRLVLGRAAAPNEPYAVRTGSDSGLPWTLHVSSSDPAADAGLFAFRRRLLLAAFGLAGVLLVAGGCPPGRSGWHRIPLPGSRRDAADPHGKRGKFRGPLPALGDVARNPGSTHRKPELPGKLRCSGSPHFPV